MKQTVEYCECSICNGLIIWMPDEEEWQHVRTDMLDHRPVRGNYKIIKQSVEVG